MSVTGVRAGAGDTRSVSVVCGNGGVSITSTHAAIHPGDAYTRCRHAHPFGGGGWVPGSARGGRHAPVMAARAGVVTGRLVAAVAVVAVLMVQMMVVVVVG